MFVSGCNKHKRWRATHSLEKCSPLQISSNTSREGLTFQMGVHPFLSEVLICSNPRERLTPWMGVHPFSSVVLICSNNGEGLTAWMGVHPLSSVVPICSKPQTLGGTHKLDECSPIIISHGLMVVLNGSNIGEGLTSWMDVHPFQSVVLIYPNNGEGLTAWIGVQPFTSVVLLCSNTEKGLTA